MNAVGHHNYASSHLLTLGLVHYRVSTFATIVDHTLLSSVIDSSRPCSLMYLDIVHPSDAGPASGSFSRYFHIKHSSCHVFRLSSLYMSIPTESPFGNLIYNWHNVQSLSNLLNPYMVFQTNPLDPTEHSHLGLM